MVLINFGFLHSSCSSSPHTEIQIFNKFLSDEYFYLICAVSPYTWPDSFKLSVRMTEIQQTADSVKNSAKIQDFIWFQSVHSFWPHIHCVNLHLASKGWAICVIQPEISLWTYSKQDELAKRCTNIKLECYKIVAHSKIVMQVLLELHSRWVHQLYFFAWTFGNTVDKTIWQNICYFAVKSFMMVVITLP